MHSSSLPNSLESRRFVALDDRIDAFAEIYKEAHSEVQFSNPEYQTQSIVNVIGRICSDANEGKSNERSLLLETSRALGSGSRVRLDTSEVSGVSFFPGQIVVLSGINANGSVFVVTRVHEVFCRSSFSRGYASFAIAYKCHLGILSQKFFL